MFGIYVFSGLPGTILALYYKVPVSDTYSIPGATLMGTALAGYSFNEATGAFIIAGVIALIIGLSGAIEKIMQFLPLEIVMAMVGGAMMKFGSGIVTTTQVNPLVCGAAVLAFFLVPRVVVPAFNDTMILSCSIPLAALVMGAENAQAMGVLRTESYPVPANTMTVASGIGDIIFGLFGAHNANIADSMTAICCSSDAGEKEGRYVASVVNGIAFALFGVVRIYAITFVDGFPAGLANCLDSLAMMNVLNMEEKARLGISRQGGHAVPGSRLF